MFGKHLILEAKGCPQELIDDINLVSKFIDNLPDLLNMTKIMPPYTFRYSGKVPEDFGVSGICLIAESHISYHGFSCKGHVFLDVFTCCPDLNSTLIVEEFSKTFRPIDYEVQILDRGREFPRSEGRAELILSNERLTYS